jgi:hypothetical protein
MSNRDRDFKPEEGQQSNQNWDDSNDRLNPNKEQPGQDEQTSDDTTSAIDQRDTTGVGSSQRTETGSTGYGSVGPMDAELDQLPSEKRGSRGNQTGPGLG